MLANAISMEGYQLGGSKNHFVNSTSDVTIIYIYANIQPFKNILPFKFG